GMVMREVGAALFSTQHLLYNENKGVVPRMDHHHCQVGVHIFAFCGYDIGVCIQNTCTKSIEKIPDIKFIEDVYESKRYSRNEDQRPILFIAVPEKIDV